MKNQKKLIFIHIFGLLVFTSFLIPRTSAQEWAYDGADTTNIPGFSVYPSEEYHFKVIMTGYPAIDYILEIVKGNITDSGTGNGTGVWGNMWWLNITSGEKILDTAELLIVNWNETIGFLFLEPSFLIPVENDGKVSLSILNNLSATLSPYATDLGFDAQQVYPSLYSIAFWNTSNNEYFHLNYTDGGILSHQELKHSILPGNLFTITLISQPAKLPPAFSFTTESGNLTVKSSNFKLNITITDVDNNNDGLVDTDYQYRIQYDSTWSDWNSPPSQLNWTLGSVPSGNYNITMEVKNMYGITQEQITIDYKAFPESFILSSDAGFPDADGNFNLNWMVAAKAINYSIFEYSGFITVINDSLSTLVTGTSTPSRQLSGYTNGTYYFIVQAYNNLGDTLSNCIKVVVAIPPEAELSAPTIPGFNLFFLLITSTVISSILIRKRRKKL